uniref:Uncharacterized protein n=1 Tax=Lotharella globosa TaxID=91324 RepID=A0A7S3YRA6_9EUKA
MEGTQLPPARTPPTARTQSLPAVHPMAERGSEGSSQHVTVHTPKRTPFPAVTEMEKQRASEARESRYYAGAVGRIKRKCSELPPFGVPEVLMGITGALAILATIASATGHIAEEDKDYAAYPYGLFAFFTAFGLRAQIPSVIIQGLLLILAIILLSESIPELSVVYGGYQRLCGWLILAGLLGGWGIKFLVLAGHHFCRPKAQNYEEFLRDGDQRSPTPRSSEAKNSMAKNSTAPTSDKSSMETTDEKKLPLSAPPKLRRLRTEYQAAVMEVTKQLGGLQNAASPSSARGYYRDKGNYFKSGVERDELGVINGGVQDPRLGVGHRYFPPFRCWEVLTPILLVTALALCIYYEVEGKHAPDADLVEAGIVIISYVAYCLSLSRFDSKYLAWTILFIIIVLTSLFAQVIVIAMRTDGKTIITLVGNVLACTVWILRVINDVVYKIRKGKKKNPMKEALYDALRKRGFQTGDVLITGSVASFADYVARLATASAWGHVAIVIRGVSTRSRVLFAVGNWLQRMPGPMKRWVLSRAPSYRTLHELAPAIVSSLSETKLEQGERGELHLDMVDVLNSASVIDAKVGDIPAKHIEHCKKYQVKVPRSKNKLYVVEAVGTGTRMVTLEKFMAFWHDRRYEYVAWRPLYCKNAEADHHPFYLGYDSAKILAGRPYVNFWGLLKGPFFRAVGCCETDRQPLSFFCSSMAGRIYSELRILKPEIDPQIDLQTLTPGDFGDDGAQTAVVEQMRDPWTLGSVVYLGMPKRPRTLRFMQRLFSVANVEPADLGADKVVQAVSMLY